MSYWEPDDEKSKTGKMLKITARKEKYGALVLLMDCGNTMNKAVDGQSCFSMAKEAADWILSRKIFSQSKDKVAIILFGFEETKNAMGVPGVYIQNDVLSCSHFDHLRFLNYEVRINFKSCGDVVDALIVATNFLDEKTNGDSAVESRNILILSNALTECRNRDEDVSSLIRRITALGVNLIALGINDDVLRRQVDPAPVLSDIVKQTDGMCYSFKDGLSAIRHFTTPMIESRAIRKNWEIAPGVRLPLAMYTKATAAKNPLRTIFVNEEGTEMHRESHALAELKREGRLSASHSTVLQKINLERQRLHVYYFGDTKVPIGEEDEAQYRHHNFNEGEQRGCMKLIQFAKREYMKECYFVGHNSFVAVPGWEKKTAERDSRAMYVTFSLINAMLENNVLAICRYASDAAKHLQLMALIPHKDEHLGFVYLRVFRLPFAEDMRPFNFVNVSVSCPKPTHQQENLVDELIDAMQFSAEDGSVEPECVLNPFFQRHCTTLKLKALNTSLKRGDESKIGELISPSAFLKRGLEPNSKLIENAKHVLSALSTVENGFDLQEVERTKRQKMEVQQEDISEWLAELTETEKESKPKVVAKNYASTHVRFIDRARARLCDNFEFHMASLLDEVSVMTGAEDEEAAMLYGIALARLTSLRSLAIEFGRHAEFNEWLLCSRHRWPEWTRFCSSKTIAPTLISDNECPSSEYSECEAAAIWSDNN